MNANKTLFGYIATTGWTGEVTMYTAKVISRLRGRCAVYGEFGYIGTFVAGNWYEGSV